MQPKEKRLGICSQDYSKRGLGLDDLILHSVADQFGHRVEVHFEHDVGAMGFCGLYAYVEVHGNFLVAFSLGQQLHNFTLARSQATGWALALRTGEWNCL